MRRLWLAIALVVALCAPAVAQTTTIRATDPSTGAAVEAVGDATFNGVRMVPAGNAWLVSGLLLESTFDTKIGSLTETAPATDTASSGLNGRLQRIAQRTTTIITTLGTPFQAGGSIGNTTFGATQSGTWTVQPGNTANTTAWLVTGTGGTFPVTGTFWQATQPVSGPLTDAQLRAAAVPVSGTFWQATQPVSAAALPLPSGASTLGEQQTQTTALQVIDNLPVAQASTTSGQSGVLAQGAVTTSAPSYTNAQTSPLSLTPGGALRTDSSATTQPVSASSLPLPTGAATAANQATAITSLQTIDDPVATIGGVPLTRVAVYDDAGNQITSFSGGGGGGGTEYTEDAAAAANPVGGALVLVRDDALSGQTTTDGDNVAARGTDKGEVYVKHADSIAVTGPLTDAQLRASAVPVDGSGVTQPVSAASLPLPSGASTSAAQTTGNNSLSSIDGKLATAKTADLDTGGGTDTVALQGIALPGSGGAVVGGTATNPVRVDPTGSTTQPVSAASLPLPTGAATESTLGTRLSESDFDSKVGSLTESAPGTDTASSGLNGRLQRIAQRMTSMLAVLPSALTGSGNFKVAVQEALPAGTNNIGDVDVASSALPTGASTLAEQQTQTTALGAIQTAAQIVDDWDESDRAKVNPIVGQAGIQGGAGAVSANTTRVALATDGNVIQGAGTAGSAAGGVVTVQGSASGTAIPVSVASLPSHAVTNAGTFAVQNTAATPAGTNNIGDVDVLTMPATRQFFGTAQTVISTATDIAASNFSGAPSATYDNTNDGSYPQVTRARAMLEVPDWAAAPVAGTTVDLYGIILNVDSTDDETDAPSGTAAGGAHYFGSWTLAARDDGTVQRRVIMIDVAGFEQIDFYIRNGTAQNMNNDGGTSAVVKITPLTTN